MARSHTDMAIRVLAGVARNTEAPPSARITAAGMLLDRGWGRAPQEHTGLDGGDIRVTIRQLIETVTESDTKLIEHDEDEVVPALPGDTA